MANEPTSYEDWAKGWLDYLGAPATGPDDPRVKVIEGWESVEAPPAQDFGNVGPTYNPLDVEYDKPYYNPLPGQGQWNTQGVSTFPNAAEGYEATTNFWSNPTDDPIIKALSNPKATQQEIANALYGGAFADSTVGSPANVDYVNSILQNAGINASYSGGPPGVLVTQNTPAAKDTYMQDPESISKAGVIGQILIQLDLVLNPTHTIKAPSTLEDIFTLGAAGAVYGVTDIAMIVATVIFRAFFVLGFLALLWVGIQQLTGGVAGRVLHAGGTPFRLLGKGATTAGRFYGTPIQRAREARLASGQELRSTEIAARAPERELRIARGQQQLAQAPSRLQAQQQAIAARQQMLATEPVRARQRARRLAIAQRNVALKERAEARRYGRSQQDFPEDE